MKLPGYDGKYIQTGVQILKNIQEDIKSGKFKQVYLLYGEEAHLKQQYKRNLVKALNPDDDTMNFARYEGKGIDMRELISLFDTMPFLRIEGPCFWRIPAFLRTSVRSWRII